MKFYNKYPFTWKGKKIRILPPPLLCCFFFCFFFVPILNVTHVTYWWVEKYVTTCCSNLVLVSSLITQTNKESIHSQYLVHIYQQTMLIKFLFLLTLLIPTQGLLHQQGLRDPPSSGKPLPPEQWFIQRLDHFKASDLRTWKQRFWINWSYYKPGGPALIMIGIIFVCYVHRICNCMFHSMFKWH